MIDLELDIDALNRTINDVLEQADKDLNFDGMLSKYGPEGLYLIAGKLKQIADADVAQALAETAPKSKCCGRCIEGLDVCIYDENKDDE